MSLQRLREVIKNDTLLSAAALYELMQIHGVGYENLFL